MKVYALTCNTKSFVLRHCDSLIYKTTQMPSYQVEVPGSEQVRIAAHAVGGHTGIKRTDPAVSHTSTAQGWDESPRHEGTDGTPRTLPHYYQHTDATKRKRVSTGDICCFKIVLLFCAFLFPPLAVFLQSGCNKTLVINLLLTILGYVMVLWKCVSICT